MHRAMTCVRQFNEKFGLEINESPHLPEEHIRKFRMKLLEDQYHEYRYAERGEDLIKVTDAMADMVYVICGTALEYGIPLAKIFAEVHRSNMTKGGVGEDGKVFKGKEFDAPDIAGILCEEIYGDD